MQRSLQRPPRLATIVALVTLVTLGIAPASPGYSGGPDRFDAASLKADTTSALGSYSGGPDRLDAASLRAGRTTLAAVAPTTTAGSAGGPERTRGTLADYELDPAIRFAIAKRATGATPVAAPVTEAIPAPDNGFAWGAAALGLGAGIAGMFLVLGCVTLVRHDGRLRSA
jgi:hypothetical protein